MNDVVQLSPEDPDNKTFAGCFMLVTEVRPWGAIGFFSVPVSREELPGEAYYRAKWEEMEYIGHAVWAPARDERYENATTVYDQEEANGTE